MSQCCAHSIKGNVQCAWHVICLATSRQLSTYSYGNTGIDIFVCALVLDKRCEVCLKVIYILISRLLAK